MESQNRVWALCAVVLLWIAACQTQNAPDSADATATPDTSADPSTHGAALSAGESLALGEVLKAPQEFLGKSVRVEGFVRKACSKKGCWMELADGATESAQGCRVTFKDYGFFVPKDSAGSAARVEGTVNLKEVPADQVAHFEKEGGTFATKNPDGSANEVHIIATGVELTRL